MLSKKAFQSNTNHTLSDSPCFTVNKFECVCGWGGADFCTGGHCLAKMGDRSLSPVHRTLCRLGTKALYRDPPREQTELQTDTHD